MSWCVATYPKDARLPPNRTRARGIHALPPPRVRIQRPRRGPRARPRCKAAGSPFRSSRCCCCWRGSLGRRWLLGHDGDGGGAHKHAIAGLAVKVLLALDTAVVLAGAVVQLDADPDARGKVRVADEADDGVAAVGEPDGLARYQVRHCFRLSFFFWVEVLLRYDHREGRAGWKVMGGGGGCLVVLVWRGVLMFLLRRDSGSRCISFDAILFRRGKGAWLLV